MEYTINKLAKLAGVSTRTLRYYDQRGLLSPRRVSNGYRVYGVREVGRLQQIMFYRELGVPLSEISRILDAEDFDGASALQEHLAALRDKRVRLDLLIANVEKSMRAMKGETSMSDHEKFEGFKQALLDENERNYGGEIRAKYGEDAIERSNAKVRGMTQEQYAEAERLSEQLNEVLKAAFEQGDPQSELARQACELHKKWLCLFWESYSEQAHIGLVQMYVDDPRFTAYYDKIAPGCAQFLRDAVNLWLAK